MGAARRSVSALPEQVALTRTALVAEVAATRSHFDFAVHCASSGGGDAEDYRKIYLQGARYLLEELQLRKLIFTSSTSVYAQTDAQWVDEESAADPMHESAATLNSSILLISLPAIFAGLGLNPLAPERNFGAYR